MAKPKALPTFEVDKEGLAKLLQRKGKEFAVAELVQNAWDEDVTEVNVTLDWQEGGAGPDGEDSIWRLEVEDDNPSGFADIAHAYTLFADSAKKDDPEKRGRFNLGEKLVIAMCEEANIITTSGRVKFTPEGRTMDDKLKTEYGSIFRGFVTLTDKEAKAIERLMFKLITPAGITTTFEVNTPAQVASNPWPSTKTTLPTRQPRHTFQISLRTERADAEGYLRPTTRKAKVEVFDRQGGEPGMLYELGIPVVETGDTYHVNVGQKVPLNTDRDNVPPSYLRDVRAAVLNEIYADLDKDSAAEQWVNDALEDDSVSAEAVQAVVTHRYGDKAVTADPSDREAEKIAMSKGYTVIPAGAFSKGAWKAVKSSAAVLPAGQVTPSPKPDEGDDVLNLMPEDQWPSYVKQFARYAQEIGGYVLGDVDEIVVRIAQPKTRVSWPYSATWKRHPRRPELTLNFTGLGYPWFEKAMSPAHGPTVSRKAHALLIHEFAHQDASEHLSEAFYNACCKYGAALAEALAGQPDLKALIVDEVDNGPLADRIAA